MDLGVHTTVVTAGHCMHTELTTAGMLCLAVACTPFWVYANKLANYSLSRNKRKI